MELGRKAPAPTGASRRLRPPRAAAARHSLTASSCLLVALVVVGQAARAAESWPLGGYWRGELATPAGPLTLVLTLGEDGKGTIAAPSRGLSGIPVTQVVLDESRAISFRVPADAAAFEGRLIDGDRIEGAWIQAGQRVELALTRSDEAPEGPAAPLRRQTPHPPYPYRVEEVGVETAGERLACTLTLPEAAGGEVPGAVLLTVAGANDRDQTHSGHKPYAVLADHLTRAGMATLRCDDRGVGSSTGDLLATTIGELAQDALALVRYLRGRAGIGPIGVIGNSEGSVVGSLAAAEAPDEVAYAVLLGGVGVRGAALIRARLLAQAQTSGRSSEEIEAATARFDALAELVAEAGGVGAAELERSRPDLYGRLRTIAEEAGTSDPFLPPDTQARVELFAGRWYHAQLTLDGGAILERVRVAVLALTGSKDRTNLPGQNLPAIRAALERGRNPDFEVRELPGLNHVFQTAREGGMREYASLEESFSPIALELITAWILERFARDGGEAP